MPLFRTALRFGTASAIVALLGCGPDAAPRRPGEPVRWPVSAEPSLALGVVEGDSMYQFFSAKSAVRLADGSVVVANTGTGEIRRFDEQGRFVWRAGGRGGGPGEFGSLVRIYGRAGDSILAFDESRRMSVFGPRGAFARSYQVARDPENPFPLDAWLHSKTWVEGPLDTALRAPLKRALDRLPPLPADQVYRFVRVDDTGLLWAREPLGADPAAQRWTVYDSTGATLARADTPLRFEVYQIGEDFILGRWRNEEDVEFVHAYGLTRTTATPIPAAPQGAPADELDEIDTEEFLSLFRSVLRNLVIAQERHYAYNSTYTRNVADFETFDFGEVVLDILSADNRGWVGVGSHPRSPVICAMAVADATPPGWAQAVPLCADGTE